MGSSSSKLSHEEINDLLSISSFTEQELYKLYNRYKHLDKDKTGSIRNDEFLSIPELSMNPLASRIIKVF
ncbi:Calcineurin subunit B type 2, partial [Lobulomyces angularis]